MIELNSSVHTSGAALLEELELVREPWPRKRVSSTFASRAAAHTRSTTGPTGASIPNERFLYVVERYGYLAKQFTVFGQHIHIGCPGGDDAVYLAHILTRYIPHFIALSAASPFYQGEDTSFQSSRLTAVSAFPLAGHIPFVQDWAEFMAYFDKMKGYGIVGSMKDFYWDIRPKPEYGTSRSACATPR
jgi:glutamate---cysteine ligase / carboxylate-amine ligase